VTNSLLSIVVCAYCKQPINACNNAENCEGVDLNELEHDAREGTVPPSSTIAMILRIRELDEALGDALTFLEPGPDRDRLVEVYSRRNLVARGYVP
jgi:hypothetical protein